MSKKSVFHQVVASHIFILAGFLLVLNHSACNCQNPKYQNKAAPKDVGGQDDTKPKGMHLVIKPVGSTQLEGLDDTEIKFLVCNMITNGDPVDFTKLKLHITTSDAISHVKEAGNIVEQLPRPGAVDLDFKTIYTLTLQPDPTSAQVIVELQLYYDNKKLETTDSKCTFTWERDLNDVTKKLFEAMYKNTHDSVQEALKILQSPKRTHIQPNASFTHPAYHKHLFLLEILNWNPNATYESLIKEVLTLPGINVNQILELGIEKTPLSDAIETQNLFYTKLLLEKKAKVKPGSLTTNLHHVVSLPYSDINKEITQHILDNDPTIINAQDADGNTALHIAIKHRVDTTILAKLQQLRAGGVDHMLANKAFQTPLAYLTAINATTPISNFEALKAALQ
jgi:hypothetical protein